VEGEVVKVYANKVTIASIFHVTRQTVYRRVLEIEKEIGRDDFEIVLFYFSDSKM